MAVSRACRAGFWPGPADRSQGGEDNIIFIRGGPLDKEVTLHFWPYGRRCAISFKILSAWFSLNSHLPRAGVLP